MRWKLFYTALLTLVLLGTSCSKRSDDGGSTVILNPDGWELVSWNGDRTIAGRVYLELQTTSFTLYQQIGNLESVGYTTYRGSCTFTTDAGLGTVLSGVYSDGTPWARSYRVETMTDTELRLVSIDEQIVSEYERVVIPDYVKEAPVTMPSRAVGSGPLL